VKFVKALAESCIIHYQSSGGLLPSLLGYLKSISSIRIIETTESLFIEEFASFQKKIVLI
jgi:hypothetical protein